MLKRTLFVGNDVNRLMNTGLSWDDVLKELVNDVNGDRLLTYQEYIPFTLIYEGFSSKSQMNSKRGETPLKNRAAKLLSKIKSNGFHAQIMHSGVNHIITTNYDYSLENAISQSDTPKYVRRESRYSVFRRAEIACVNVWHIHGDIDKPATITLGHEQYSGQLENFRKHLTSKKTHHSELEIIISKN